MIQLQITKSLDTWKALRLPLLQQRSCLELSYSATRIKIDYPLDPAQSLALWYFHSFLLRHGRIYDILSMLLPKAREESLRMDQRIR